MNERESNGQAALDVNAEGDPHIETDDGLGGGARDADAELQEGVYDAEDDFFADDMLDDEGSKAVYMQNRELSWLTFNERVLDQGADESVPLLERLDFISIFWSNLQEFFMVRVGSLTDLSYIDPPVHDSKTGMTPKEQIRAIHERVSELYPIQESYYEHVRGSLAKEGVRHLRPEDISEEQKNYLFGLVRHNIEPFLSPQIINSRHPFPHLENGKLYILVRLDDAASEAERKRLKKERGKKAKKEIAEGVLFGLIPLPHQCERVIKLPGRGFQFILLEHAIEMFVPEIFSMYKIKHTNVICVTRNADIDANQGFDEQDEDYREHMKRLLKQRARLAPVRLECERPLSPVMERLMLSKLKLKRYQVYDTIVPLDLSFTWGLGARLSEKKRGRLKNTPFSPAWPTCFDKNRRIMDQVEERETLLFYPYESMDPFVQLLREASVDPDVVSIKITLYRLASQSHLAEALIAAADNGKEVTALFELRARFDENNNIVWSQRFEEAGCNVIYGFRDYKVHSKICCITRRTADGVQHITQLGTGNYNEKTAKLYTDLSFITTSEEFGRDAVEFFRNMQLEHVSDNYNVLRVAPLQIKPLILDNLDNQIRNARAGKPATAFLKANSITDKDVIEKISEASNAGVKITLFVRGICCIVPRVAGATENVRVVSIVGRLLEHSRIYCFGSNDDCVVYLSSADLMTRNLNKRIEIAWPILDPDLRDKVLTYIDICMHDTAKLRELRPNATYTPLGAFSDIDEEGNAKPALDAQNTLIDQAAEAARIMSELESQEKAEEQEEAAPSIAAAAAAAAELAANVMASDDAQGGGGRAADEPMAEGALADGTPMTADDSLGADSSGLASPSNSDEGAASRSVDEFAHASGEDATSLEGGAPTGQASASSASTPARAEGDVTDGELAASIAENAGAAVHIAGSEPLSPLPEGVGGEDSASIESKPIGPSGLGDAGTDALADSAGVVSADGIAGESGTVGIETATPDISGDAVVEDAASAAVSAGVTDALSDTSLTANAVAGAENSLPEASERVAELIDQLGSIPEQKVGPALEPLTDMKIQDIVTPLQESAPTASEQMTPELGQVNAPQSVNMSLGAMAEGVTRTASGATVETGASVAAQPAANDSKNEDDGRFKKAPDGSVEEYFSDNKAEIEMPKKKKGFWSRWFG